MIAITGATGHLGQLVIQDLLQRGFNPKDIVAVVRSKSKAQDLSAKGIQVKEADYSSSEALEKAFTGVENVLLISGSEVGQRLPQHTNVVNAAKKANVKLLIYTSILKADESKMALAVEHLATEKVIQSSGVPFVILRNGWYIENYTQQMASFLEQGAVTGAAKEGRVSAATRADYASAAAAALLGKAKINSVYELGGQAFTLPQLAETISQASGKNVQYQDMPASEYEKMLSSVGVPAPMAHVLADSDVGIVRSELFTDRKDLETLIGRPATTLKEAVAAALKH